MPYDYIDERNQIFTDKGQREFLEVRDRVNGILQRAGAIRMQEALGCGSVWTQMSYVDRMVELGEIVEITGPDVIGQYRVFVKAYKP